MRNVLFDFDGTLVDTWPGIKATLCAVVRELDLAVPYDEISPTLVGMPLARVFEKLLEGNSERAEAAAQKYRDLFPITGLTDARTFEGVQEVLGALKNEYRQLFIVTARNEIITKQMMAENNLSGIFTWVRGEREGELPDSKIHMVEEVMEMFHLDPGDCVMVGDRRYDMEAALANGISTIGVTYGYGKEQELLEAGAQQLVGSIQELKEVLINGG